MHVHVLVAETLGLGEADAVDDGGVVEFVGDNGVLGGGEGLGSDFLILVIFNKSTNFKTHLRAPKQP